MFLEEYAAGTVESFGSYRVTREEVIEFAGRYDPQPFHLNDDAAAENRIFGRLAASGWHTAAMTMRMLVDHAGSAGAFSLGSPGVDELRWLRPVYPGDTLSVRTEVADITVSRSRPDIGTVRLAVSTLNQHGEEVMRFVSITLQSRRPAGPTS